MKKKKGFIDRFRSLNLLCFAVGFKNVSIVVPFSIFVTWALFYAMASLENIEMRLCEQIPVSLKEKPLSTRANVKDALFAVAEWLYNNRIKVIFIYMFSLLKQKNE